MKTVPKKQFESELASDVKALRFYRTRLRCSKVDAYKNEILILRQLDLSFNDIAFWLNNYHGVSISSSSLSRRFNYWMNNNGTGNQFRSIT